MPTPSPRRVQFRAILRDAAPLVATVPTANGGVFHGQLTNWQLSPLLERVIESDVGNVLQTRDGLDMLENLDMTLQAEATVIQMWQSFTGEVEVEIFNAEMRSSRATSGARQFDRLGVKVVADNRGIDIGQVGFNQTQADSHTLHCKEITVSRRETGAGSDTEVIYTDGLRTLRVNSVDLLADLKTALDVTE